MRNKESFHYDINILIKLRLKSIKRIKEKEISINLRD